MEVEVRVGRPAFRGAFLVHLNVAIFQNDPARNNDGFAAQQPIRGLTVRFEGAVQVVATA